MASVVPMLSPAVRPGRTRRRRGFTLLEATLTTVIIGTGVVAALSMFQACARANGAGAKQTSAMMLADETQELLARYPFNDPQTEADHFGPEPDDDAHDDLDDFDGLTFSPPVDGARRPIRELSEYRQLITVNPVLPTALSANERETVPELPKSTYTGAVRVRVRILHQPKAGPATEVHRASFLRFDR